MARPKAARAIARAAGAVLARCGGHEQAKAAARAAAGAFLPALPAPMLAEAVAAVAPTEASPPERTLAGLGPVDAADSAERLRPLTGGADLPARAGAERLAGRLAAAGAVRVSGRVR